MAKSKAASCDDHTQLMIQASIEKCKADEVRQIEEVDKKAGKAHARLDDHYTRICRLDDPEMGKVSILWRDRRMILVVIGIVVLNLVLQFIRVGGGSVSGPATAAYDSGAIKAAVKAAVVETLKDIKPGKGGE